MPPDCDQSGHWMRDQLHSSTPDESHESGGDAAAEFK